MSAQSGARMPVEWKICQASQFSDIGAGWDQLVGCNAFPAFMRAECIQQAISAFGCLDGIVALGHSDGRLVAAGVIVPRGWGRWVCYQPSQLPLGAWVMDRSCAWSELLTTLLTALPGTAVSLSITQQDPLLVERPMPDRTTEVLDYVETGWIDVAGSFEDFWQARGKNLRQNLRKQRKRLEEQGHRLTFDYLTEPDDVHAAFLGYAALESAGWKAAEGTAISADNPQGRFYQALLRDQAARGMAFALRLVVDGAPAAVDFGLRDDKSMVILKTTYDENLKAYSPAQLLHEQAFEHVFREGLTGRIEFYGKMMDWHRRWTEQSRMLFHVNAFRAPWVRRLRDAAKRLGKHRRVAEPVAEQE